MPFERANEQIKRTVSPLLLFLFGICGKYNIIYNFPQGQRVGSNHPLKDDFEWFPEVFGTKLFFRQIKRIIMKKGINHRKPGGNQTSLLLNTQYIKKGQTSFSLLASIAQLECCSPQHASSRPLQGFLCVCVCVCVCVLGRR